MKSSSKRVENLCCKKVGNSEIKVFAENQITDNPLLRKAEFIFEIDSSTKKQLDFPIGRNCPSTKTYRKSWVL